MLLSSRLKNHLTALALIGITFGCGSEMPSSQRNGPIKEFRPNGADANPNDGCALASLSETDKSSGLISVDINTLKITHPTDGVMTICSYMQKESLGSAVFQFAGVFCSSCQEEAEFFESKFSSRSIPGVAHIIVFTDFMEDYPESSFSTFMQTYSPHALRIHDPNIELWKFFSKNPMEPLRPTALAVNAEGLGNLVNTEGASVEHLYDLSFELFDRLENSADFEGERRPNDPSSDEQEKKEEQPGPSNPNSEIPASRDFQLQSATEGSKKLSDQFTGEYMLLDFSQFFCSACKSFADSHQNDAAFQQAMDGTTCQMMVVIPDRDRASWYGRYPTQSYIGSISVSVASQMSVLTGFGLNLSSIPYFVFIDKKGQVVDQRIGGMPTKAQQICFR